MRGGGRRLCCRWLLLCLCQPVIPLNLRHLRRQPFLSRADREPAHLVLLTLGCQLAMRCVLPSLRRLQSRRCTRRRYLLLASRRQGENGRKNGRSRETANGRVARRRGRESRHRADQLWRQPCKLRRWDHNGLLTCDHTRHIRWGEQSPAAPAWTPAWRCGEVGHYFPWRRREAWAAAKGGRW